MKPIHIAAIILAVLAVFSQSWNATGLAALSEPVEPASVESYQLLVNPGMEQSFVPYGYEFQFDSKSVACEVATGWTRFGDVDPRPCWMDARDFANDVMGSPLVEKIEGETSQVIISTEEQSAGMYQQVSGLTPGMPYGFQAAMLTIFQSSAAPIQDERMIKWVGMDPTGGIDPNADTVVWSEPEGMDKIWDLQRRVSVVAASSTMTVFILVEADDPGNWPYVNQSFLDSAILARTATVSAVSPAYSLQPTFTVRWDNAEASSTDVTIVKYDVQWMDEEDGQWVDWLIGTQKTQDLFTGQWGHTYRFRASAWQHYPNDAYLYSPYAPEEGAPTWVVGARLVGQVCGNGPYTFGGVEVSIVDTEFRTVSRQDGTYQMLLDLMEVPQTVTVGGLTWLPPEPAYEVVFGAGETITLNWALRPPDDAVRNGGFEGSLSDWVSISEQGAEPTTVEDPVHTGVGAAMLGGQGDLSPEAGYASGVEQTVELARSWNPNLAFWYLPETADSGDRLTITLAVETDPAGFNAAGDASAESMATPLDLVFTPPLDVEGWQHQWYSLGTGQAYFTGTVTIHFEVWNDGDEFPTTVYLDEVSLGRTPGGPFRSYLPLVSK